MQGTEDHIAFPYWSKSLKAHPSLKAVIVHYIGEAQNSNRYLQLFRWMKQLFNPQFTVVHDKHSLSYCATPYDKMNALTQKKKTAVPLVNRLATLTNTPKTPWQSVPFANMTAPIPGKYPSSLLRYMKMNSRNLQY